MFLKPLAKSATLLAAALIAQSLHADQPALPKSMLWATYDVGSSGYVEASAVADAFGKTYGTRVRIMPSGTSISRLLPLKTGRVQYGWLANELYFATEATYEFAAQEWGPQDLRVIAGRPSTFGMAVAGDSDIATMADLRGKRVARIKANPSINIKIEAMLAFGGLSWDDVEVVELPSYGAMLKALVDGQVDAVGSTPTAATLYEMESSSHGIAWVPMPAGDAEGWNNITSVASFFAPVDATAGAGLSQETPAAIFSVRYPMITVYADADEEEVYNFIKALDQTYDLYASATAATPGWDLNRAGRPPADAPFHPGAIRYLKEKGIWTEADDAWNARRLERLNAVISTWQAASEAAADQSLPAKDWPAFWDKYRKDMIN
ncbi:TAXI family TRAP transporter solute-binding subunit [Pseudodonghicola flavimaris]|uniref:TAXI family TRAP transporter solute-binding subunit n=1 Tax=Pseudodonghicola flavimaris TaxID=3050036 RepID=A0ABT7F2T5_9RHOB|nr:TAXI family TRAP transporter solute-binding subunit [Pseudodonghicola flavimaris]MDK3018885.1 TAXI family TRAP transporter solute-binding subunit [Pseudodonghicola flavimaris]